MTAGRSGSGRAHPPRLGRPAAAAGRHRARKRLLWLPPPLWGALSLLGALSLIPVGLTAWESRKGREDPLTVDAVVAGGPVRPSPNCDGTVVVTGTVMTRGRAGTVRYRWRTSDGNRSQVLTQQVPGGSNPIKVALRWTFRSGNGLQLTATLDILSPNVRSASVAFPFTCV
jgi:hypothetical protein